MVNHGENQPRKKRRRIQKDGEVLTQVARKRGKTREESWEVNRKDFCKYGWKSTHERNMSTSKREMEKNTEGGNSLFKGKRESLEEDGSQTETGNPKKEKILKKERVPGRT